MFPRDGHPGCSHPCALQVGVLPRCALSILPTCATSFTLQELLSPASALAPFASGSPSSHPPASKLQQTLEALCRSSQIPVHVRLSFKERAARQIAGRIGNERHGSESKEKRAAISPSLQEGEKSPALNSWTGFPALGSPRAEHRGVRAQRLLMQESQSCRLPQQSCQDYFIIFQPIK